jgi:hypothetical protein
MHVIADNYGIPSPPRYFYKGEPEHPDKPKTRPASPKPEPKPEPEAQNSGATPSTGRFDWRNFVIPLMQALLPYPEAKEAVVLAFRERGAEASP